MGSSGVDNETAHRMVGHLPSVTCKEPGAAHKARNCTNQACVLHGLCQYRTQAEINGMNDCGDMRRIEPPITQAPFTTTVKEVVTVTTALPTDKQERKNLPIGTGVLDYFPAALAEVARTSKAGNDQHNPGQELHWARGKSMDHFDAMIRHLMERGTIDTDGIRHTAKAAWRILALLQEEMEAAGAPMSRASRVVE